MNLGNGNHFFFQFHFGDCASRILVTVQTGYIGFNIAPFTTGETGPSSQLTQITSVVDQNVFNFSHTLFPQQALIQLYPAFPSPLATSVDIGYHLANITLMTVWRCIVVFVSCMVVFALVTWRWTATQLNLPKRKSCSRPTTESFCFMKAHKRFSEI